MSLLTITRPPQFTDPWFAEIEQVWDELEFAINDIEGRVVTLETQIVSDVVTSVSKSGSPQLTGDVVFTQSGTIALTQTGNTIDIGGGGVTDHGALTGLGDDDHTQYLLASGSRSLGGNWSVGMYQLLNMRVENLVSDPVAGNAGRLLFNTTDLRLKVDNGTSIVDVGVTDHGLLSGLLDDDHPQYLLVDGSRAVTGNLTVNGNYTNELAESFSMLSNEDNSGTPVAFIMDTTNNIITAGGKLLSVRNAGIEKFYVDKDGNVSVPSLTSPTSAYVLIDNDNDSSTEIFSVRMDNTDPLSATELFQINESGDAQLLGNLKVGNLSVPADALDVAGNARLSGELRLYGTGLVTSDSSLTFKVDDNNDESAMFSWVNGTGTSLMTLDEAGLLSVLDDLSVSGNIIVSTTSRIQSPGNLVFQVDTDNNESAQYRWEDGTGTTVMSLTEAGDLTISGTLIGGSSPFIIQTREASGGIGFKFDTLNNFTSGALAQFHNNGVGKVFIDYAGGFSTVSSGVFGDLVRVNASDLSSGGGILRIGNGGQTTQGMKFDVNDSIAGAGLIDVGNYARIRLESTPTNAKVQISPQINVPSGDTVFEILNNTGAISILKAYGSKDVEFFGTIIGGSSPLKLKSRETNGASAVAYELDTFNALSTSGAKMLSLKNNGTEKFAVDKDGNIVVGGGSFTLVVEPSAGLAGIQSAINTVNSAGGGIVQLKAGIYSGAPIILTDINDVTVKGVGDATIIQHDNSSANETMRWKMLSIPFYAGNNITLGDTSVFTTTASDAGNFLAGDYVTIKGTDSDSIDDFEVHEVLSNGNAGTGEIQLRGSVRATYTSVQLTRGRHNRRNKIQDMKFTFTGSNGVAAISMQGSSNCLIENIFVVGGTASGSAGTIQLDAGGGTYVFHGWKNTIRNCRVTQFDVNGIGVHFQNDAQIVYNKIYEGGALADRYRSGIVVGSEDRDCEFAFNLVADLINGMGFETAVTFRRRIHIHHNKVMNCVHGGIAILDGTEITVDDNHVERCGQGASSTYYPGIALGELGGGTKNLLIRHNTVIRCKSGIQVSNNGANSQVIGNVVDTTLFGDGIVVDCAHGITTGNIVRNVCASGVGIYIARKGAVCSNNTVRDGLNHAIDVAADSASIIGNTTENNSGNGLRIENSTVDSIIMGNNCNGDGITYGTGTGNDFSNNKE